MPVRWLEDRCCIFNVGEESPGTTEERCWLMASEGNFRESATENIPPFNGKGEKVW